RIKAIVFFDDMLGSGTQIDTFMKETNLDELGKKIIFIPFAALRDSTIRIQSKYKNLIIRPVEYLDENHSFFRASNRRINREYFYTHN
ncbi:phosphoribosyltransferase-like protein, partial [Klebsiella pneumoniae]